MKYIKLFIEESDYNNYIYSDNVVFPNVSLICSTDDVRYNEEQPINANVGDVAYWDGSKIKTVALADYSDSMGQAIGVVVIPSNFLPDGKARMVALNQTDTYMCWDASGKSVDTSLPNYKSVPVCNNNGASVEYENDYGYLPSDLFFNNTDTNETCVTDSVVMYRSSETYIPSPYKETENGLIFNQEFIKTLSNSNALSDFNGKANTDVLVGLGSDYEAAVHANSYKDGVSNAEWYLPAIGELGVMMARLRVINNTISTLGGTVVPTGYYLWSSTEHDSHEVYWLDPFQGRVFDTIKDDYLYVRSFACL